MMINSLEDEETLRHFLRHGGKETLFSYGLHPEDYAQGTLEELRVQLNILVPTSHIAFIKGMENQIIYGDYLFVHADIRPSIPLEQQFVPDLRWIRKDFLDYTELHSHIVVHGHTIFNDPVVCSNRIGIDTGAYATGRLTAIGLEGGQHWFLLAVIDPPEEDEI
jgi:serine/threonine protein phosphatase 1